MKDGKARRFRVTIERERFIVERRTIEVVAYTSKAAKQIAKQRSAREGWEEITKSGANSHATTRFHEASEVLDLGEVALPDDEATRIDMLNTITVIPQ